MRRKLLVIQIVVCFVLCSRFSFALDSLTLLATLVGQSDDELYHCASAGDVNGDGFKDIIAGAPQMRVNRGHAYIFLGGVKFDSIPDVTLIGKPASPAGFSRFGIEVASAGDVNNDGYDDVIVGADFGWNYQIDWPTGQVFLYFGEAHMDSIEDLVFQGSFDDFERFGTSISSAGDINNDSYDDIIISAPFYPGGMGAGRAYIYLGGEGIDGQADICIQGGEGDCLGNSVAGVGDVNQDGYDDILVGAVTDGATGFEGRASIYFGGDPMDTVADITFWGDSSSFQGAGYRVACAGDVNGDSIPDLMIASAYEPKKMKIFLGGATIDTLPYITVGGSHAISKAGDLNKDGFGDIMVSGTIFYGGDPMDSLPDLDLPTGGMEVGHAGDINGDGYDEVLLSTTGDTTANGNVFIFTSGPASSVRDQEDQPVKGFLLSQNYPNPFNSSTAIRFSISSSTLQGRPQVTLRIYNIRGQLVRTLLNEEKESGAYQIVWDGKDNWGKEVVSGIYFYQLRAKGFTETKKMLLLK